MFIKLDIMLMTYIQKMEKALGKIFYEIALQNPHHAMGKITNILQRTS